MRVKITEKARKLYGQNCPYSTEKCESLYELDYKIQRCIDLGKKKKSSANTYSVQYYKIQFQIKDNEIVNIQRTKKCYEIDDKVKNSHYKREFRVLN